MNIPIRVLVVDDHAIVREGLRTLLNSHTDMTCVGEAGDGQQAVQLAEDLQPDVILMDIVMPHKNGIQAITEIRQRNPQAAILVLTSFTEDEQVFAALRAGAQGYILKDSSSDRLFQAIIDVYQGKSALDPAIAHKLIREIANIQALGPHPFRSLTRREIEVLRLIAQGLTTETVSQRLGISRRTVTAHINKVVEKLGLANRTEAILYAIKHGLTNSTN